MQFANYSLNLYSKEINAIFAMSEENVATRLKFFMDSEGLSNSYFADTCGIPRPTLSQLLSGRNKKISDVLVGQIHNAYPKLSIMWLLFGEGPMLKIVNPSDVDMYSRMDDDGTLPFDVADDMQIYSENPSENSYSRSFGKDDNKYRKENGVNIPSNNREISVNQLDNASKRIAELEREIMKMRSKPRKVVQITVYYDDNTFETFTSGV